MLVRISCLICLPLSLFLYGCSGSNNDSPDSRNIPQISTRGRSGFTGPDLRQPSPEQAKKARLELRLNDEMMGKTLEWLNSDKSEKSKALKEAWKKLDAQILTGSADVRAIETLHKRAANLMTRPEDQVPATEPHTVAEFRDHYIIKLANLSREAHSLEKLVADLKPIAEKLSLADFELWGEASFYCDNFDVRYPFIRSYIRQAQSFSEMAVVARQVKYPDPNLTPEVMIKLLSAVKAR